MEIIDINGNTIDKNDKISFDLSAKIIKNFKLEILENEFSNNNYNTINLRYTFDTLLPIPSGAYFELEFPYFNQDSGALKFEEISLLGNFNGGPLLKEINVRKIYILNNINIDKNINININIIYI
jgi:hypothetical protein